MGQEKERLRRLIDRLIPDADDRERYLQNAERLTEEEAAETAQEIEDILNATPAGLEAIKRFIAKERATKVKKPPS